MKNQIETGHKIEKHVKNGLVIDKKGKIDQVAENISSKDSVIQTKAEQIKKKIDMMKEIDENENRNIEESLCNAEKFIYIK